MIVSLTTIPDRIQHINLVIQSIKRQTKPVTKILLWVPYTYKGKQEYDIPQWLYDEDLVEIIRCDDLGPATKFLHSVKKLKSQEEFIVIDDDTIYSQYLIEDLTAAPFLDGPKSVKGTYWIDHDGNPNRRRDDTAPNKQRKPLRHIIKKKIDYINRTDYSTTPIICGCDGVLLKPCFFNKKIHNITPQFFNCDDIWLSGYFTAHKIKKYVVPCRSILYNKVTNEWPYEFTKKEWAELPDNITSGGVLTDYNTTPVFKPKDGMTHVQYLSDVSKINGGKYERVEIYNKAMEAFK